MPKKGVVLDFWKLPFSGTHGKSSTIWELSAFENGGACSSKLYTFELIAATTVRLILCTYDGPWTHDTVPGPMSIYQKLSVFITFECTAFTLFFCAGIIKHVYLTSIIIWTSKKVVEISKQSWSQKLGGLKNDELCSALQSEKNPIKNTQDLAQRLYSPLLWHHTMLTCGFIFASTENKRQTISSFKGSAKPCLTLGNKSNLEFKPNHQTICSNLTKRGQWTLALVYLSIPCAMWFQQKAKDKRSARFLFATSWFVHLRYH